MNSVLIFIFIRTYKNIQEKVLLYFNDDIQQIQYLDCSFFHLHTSNRNARKGGKKKKKKPPPFFRSSSNFATFPRSRTTFNFLIRERFSCETFIISSSPSPSSALHSGAGCRTARIAKHKQPRSSKGVWSLLLSGLFNMPPAQSIKPSFFSPPSSPFFVHHNSLHHSRRMEIVEIIIRNEKYEILSRYSTKRKKIIIGRSRTRKFQ